MMVVRDDKYDSVKVVNGLLQCLPAGRNCPVYTESCKYIDTENDVVFILNAREAKYEPTYGTLRRVKPDKVRAAAAKIMRQLNAEIRLQSLVQE